MDQAHKSPEEDPDDMDAKSPSEANSLDEYIEEGISSEGKKFHRCTHPGCGKIFRFKSEISRHLVIHFPSRPYQCKVKGCKKTFKRNDALENHIRIHAKNLPFACDFPGCGQKFTTKAGLKYHALKHNNERPFKCDFPGCNKSFLTASQLKQHQKAFVSHCRISNKLKIEEEKSYPDTSTTEFYPPIQKYIHANEENYPLRQEKQEEGTLPNIEQNFQTMLKYVLKENSVLEKKLEFCDKLITSFTERINVKSEYDGTPNESVWKDPSTFFTQSDSVFLDYLREKTQENK